MSKVICPAQGDMKALAHSDTLPDVPYEALWWRQKLHQDADGHFYTMQLDDGGNPTEAEITFWDHGYDQTVKVYAGKISQDDWDPPWADDDIYTVRRCRETIYLDVLCVGLPTSGHWETLTEPGNHIHPDDREEINKLRCNLPWDERVKLFNTAY